MWRLSWCLRSLCEVRESHSICCSSSQPGSDCPHWSSATCPAATSPWCWPCSPCWPSPQTGGRRGQCEAPCTSCSSRTSLTLSLSCHSWPPQHTSSQARPGQAALVSLLSHQIPTITNTSHYITNNTLPLHITTTHHTPHHHHTTSHHNQPHNIACAWREEDSVLCPT